MRENSFYIDTVREFRDRRYEYKNLVKVYKTKAEEFEKKGETANMSNAEDMMVLYESL